MSYRRTTYTIRFGSGSTKGLWIAVVVLLFLNLIVLHFGVWMDCKRGHAPYEKGSAPAFEWMVDNLQRVGACDD